MYELFIVASALSSLIIIPGMYLLCRAERGRPSPSEGVLLGVFFSIAYGYGLTDPLGLIQSFYGTATWIFGMILLSLVLSPILMGGSIWLFFHLLGIRDSMQGTAQRLTMPRSLPLRRFDKQTGRFEDI
jgi:hypothetical protein